MDPMDPMDRWYLLHYAPINNQYGGAWMPIHGWYDTEESALEAGAEQEEALEHEVVICRRSNLHLFFVTVENFQ
jgi:hypothetical protein